MRDDPGVFGEADTAKWERARAPEWSYADDEIPDPSDLADLGMDQSEFDAWLVRKAAPR